MDGIKKIAKKDRSFGLIVGLLLVGYSAYQYFQFQTIISWSTATGFFITATSIFSPRLIHPLRMGMEFAGHWIGIVNTYILLTLIYILLFIPVGLIYKITRKDILKLKKNNKLSSYWIEMKHHEESSMKNQF